MGEHGTTPESVQTPVEQTRVAFTTSTMPMEMKRQVSFRAVSEPDSAHETWAFVTESRSTTGDRVVSMLDVLLRSTEMAAVSATTSSSTMVTPNHESHRTMSEYSREPRPE